MMMMTLAVITLTMMTIKMMTMIITTITRLTIITSSLKHHARHRDGGASQSGVV
jgi:hypothetical protein